jgi:energy-coupling factor transporter ATP-binding protein EcfA2
MLQGITLDGFRSFAESTWIELAPVTVLAGANNVGKSSVLAALAALVQSTEQSSGSALLLRGDWIDLGRFDEVVSFGRTGEARTFDLGLVGDGADGPMDVTWHFEAAPGDERELARCSQVELRRHGAVERVLAGSTAPMRWERLKQDAQVWDELGNAELLSPGSVRLFTPTSSETVSLLPISAGTFRYLGPFRAEPRDLYGGRSQPKGPPLGHDGSFTAEYLYRRRHQEVDLLPQMGTRVLLGEALNAWWSSIFGVKLTARVNELERIGYTFKIDTPSAESLGLGAVGLGLSQALPIVALTLGSMPGDVIAAETPEAHLHPGAQHRLAKLLVAAARTDRQVIVETHSEHVVNAVRLAVKQRELTPAQVAIHFFEMDKDGASLTTRIALDEAGRASKWPQGFFDQAARELADLL